MRWYWHEHVFVDPGLLGSYRLERENAAALRRHVADLDPDLVMWWSMGGMSLTLIEQARRANVPALGVVHDAWMCYGPDRDYWLRRCRRMGPLRRLVDSATGVPTRFEPGGAGTWTFASCMSGTGAGLPGQT